MSNFAVLQRTIGYEFSNSELLALAMAHRSVGSHNNERLEFLGDSIVNHVIAEAIYQQFPSAREGELSRMRASLVKGETLAEMAKELGLGEHLSLGPGEKKSGGHRRGSILADALEAVAGAILLDSDVDTCRTHLLRWFGPRLADLDSMASSKDAKTRLQEYLQGRGRPLPEYELCTVSGDDHNQVFQIACKVQKPIKVVMGEGSSRRKAEQAAAEAALLGLESNAN
ncbi:MAG: ribonuclease III [Halioglobus sp.]